MNFVAALCILLFIGVQSANAGGRSCPPAPCQYYSGSDYEAQRAYRSFELQDGWKAERFLDGPSSLLMGAAAPLSCISLALAETAPWNMCGQGAIAWPAVAPVAAAYYGIVGTFRGLWLVILGAADTITAGYFNLSYEEAPGFSRCELLHWCGGGLFDREASQVKPPDTRLVGSAEQLQQQRRLLGLAGITVSADTTLRSEDWYRGLRIIWEQRAPGWWNYKEELIRLRLAADRNEISQALDEAIADEHRRE